MIRYVVEYWDFGLQVWRPGPDARDPRPRTLELGTDDIPLSVKVGASAQAATWNRAYLDPYANPPGVIQVYRFPKPADTTA